MGLLGVAREIENDLPVLLKRLALEHFCEEVRGVLGGLKVLDRDHAGAAQLPHLVELALDVTRVLRRCVAVAQVVFGSSTPKNTHDTKTGCGGRGAQMQERDARPGPRGALYEPVYESTT